MTTPKRPRDPNQLAKFIVDVATNSAPEADSEPSNPSARAGGLKGGPARAASLSAERRTEIAKKAANKRWKKDPAAQET